VITQRIMKQKSRETWLILHVKT